MLGVLLQSLVQLQAVLADFYLSGVLEEEKVDYDSESDDDEWHSFAQVQVRVPLLSANSADLRLEQRPLPPIPSALSLPEGMVCLIGGAALRLYNFPHSFSVMHGARH